MAQGSGGEVNRERAWGWVGFGLRLALAAVFIYAGAVKAPWPRRFALDIESYRLAPPALAGVIAVYLPYLEMVGGLAILIRRVAPGATLLLGTLTGVFLAALVSAWARGLEIQCGCFGAGEAAAANYLWWVSRDIGLLVGCLAVWRTLPPAPCYPQR